MSKEIKLALMYRDMWQSSGKYMPRVDQLVQVAEPIVDMGCFDRVETNGGGFEQINLLLVKTRILPSENGRKPSIKQVSKPKCSSGASMDCG